MKNSHFLRAIATISASLMVSLSMSPLFSSAIEYTPKLTLSQFSKSLSEVDANGDGSLSLAERTFDVYMDVSNSASHWSDLSVHVTLDNRLTLVTNNDGSPKTTWGEAVMNNTSNQSSYDADSKSLFIKSQGQSLGYLLYDGSYAYSGDDGNIVAFTVVLPQSISSGDKFNFSFDFQNDSDMFTNTSIKSQSSGIDNMTQYAASHCVNGFIQINGGSLPVQTTSTSTTTTTTTTIPTTTSTTLTTTIPTTTSTTSATTIPTTTSATTTSTAPTTTVYILGDIDGNKRIDAGDASIALTEYAYTSTGRGSLLSFFQKQAADVHNDGIVDAIDASLILTYYSKFSINGYASFDNL